MWSFEEHLNVLTLCVFFNGTKLFGDPLWITSLEGEENLLRINLN